jgi:hypothetical protein
MEQALAAGRGQLPSDLLAGADRIFMGEQPVEAGSKREPKATAERDRLLEEKLQAESLSPPVVTSGKSTQKVPLADDSQNARMNSSGAG